MRPANEIKSLAARVDAALRAYHAHRKQNPVTGDYAFDMTMPQLLTWAEMLHYIQGKRQTTPLLDEQLAEVLKETAGGQE